MKYFFFQICISHFLLAIVSAYYLGAGWGPYFLRTRVQKIVLKLRALAALLMAVLHLVVRILPCQIIERKLIKLKNYF